VTALLQLLVDLVEEHVREQRRQGPALRRPLVPFHHHPVRQHAGFEIAADEPQHAAVADALRHPSHQHVVVYAVEELLQVHVHHPLATGLDVPLRFDDSVVRTVTGPEAVAVLREVRARRRLGSGSCTSARGFAPRFLPTVGRSPAVAVRFDRDDFLSAGLPPARQRPCWAHKHQRPPGIRMGVGSV
jgi:hypothetical protein